VPLYPVSLRKLWIILSSLPPLLSKAEFKKKVVELTSPASAPVYMRALKAWNLVIETNHEVEIRKIQSFTELASIVIKHVLNELGTDFRQLLEDLMSKGITPKPELLYFYLQEKEKISRWKITLALRLLRACGAFRTELRLTIPPESDEEFILRILREKGAITVGNLKKYLQRRFGFSIKRIDEILTNLILAEKIILHPQLPRKIFEIFSKLRILPFEVATSEIEDFEKLLELGEDVIEVQDKTVKIKQIFPDDALIMVKR